MTTDDFNDSMTDPLSDTVEEPQTDPIEALQAEIASLKDQLLRRAADIDNMRKRAARERVQLFEDAKVGALREYLPIHDDLKRALAAIADQDLPASVVEGIRLVADKFTHTLALQGLSGIDQIGVPFDVNLHEALMRQPSEGSEPNTVIAILEPGYKLGDRVIRHAKVIVSE